MSTMGVRSLREMMSPFQQGPWEVVGVGGVGREGCLERKGVSSSFEDMQQMGESIQMGAAKWAWAWKEGRAQRLGKTQMLGRAGECRTSRAGVGIRTLFGSARAPRRSQNSGKISVPEWKPL